MFWKIEEKFVIFELQQHLIQSQSSASVIQMRCTCNCIFKDVYQTDLIICFMTEMQHHRIQNT